MARTSEAGNNRIVLGVHYPLDIMGGRIGASAQNGQYWHNEFASSIVPASRQLRDYLVSRCAADGHGTTLAACIANTKASVRAATPTIFWTQWPPSRSRTKPRPCASTPHA